MWGLVIVMPVLNDASCPRFDEPCDHEFLGLGGEDGNKAPGVRTKKSQLQELNCPHNRNTSVPTSLNKSASSGGLALQTSANRASWAMASTLPWFLGR